MTNPIVLSLIIGRSGSTLKDKNILEVMGQPLILYTASAARRSNKVHHFFVSSDCEKILSVASKAGYLPIKRPAELSSPTSQSSDVVKHAVNFVLKEKKIDIVVVQHANVGTISTSIIDLCIDELCKDESLSAVVPCHEKNEYHPFRCKSLDPNGLLVPFVDLPSGVSGNRQDLPKALFFDHSIWVLSVKNGVLSKNGQPPWECMGSKIKPYVNKMECFDVHDFEDIKKTESWIKRNKIPIPTEQYLKSL